ncbi:MAG: hypothetical protein J7K09_07125, partial [Desulfuromusa sp.]|nr:hypothetical protein [Desulfuromusa sp.]
LFFFFLKITRYPIFLLVSRATGRSYIQSDPARQLFFKVFFGFFSVSGNHLIWRYYSPNLSTEKPAMRLFSIWTIHFFFEKHIQIDIDHLFIIQRNSTMKPAASSEITPPQ